MRKAGFVGFWEAWAMLAVGWGVVSAGFGAWGVFAVAVALLWGGLVLAVALAVALPRLSEARVVALVAALMLLCGLAPLLVAVPLLVGLGLASVWPGRAALVGVGGSVGAFVLAGGLQGAGLGAPGLAEVVRGMGTPELLAGGVFLGIAAVQMLYHWRWWAPYQHLAWGGGALALALALADPARAGVFLAAAAPAVCFTLLSLVRVKKWVGRLTVNG